MGNSKSDEWSNRTKEWIKRQFKAYAELRRSTTHYLSPNKIDPTLTSDNYPLKKWYETATSEEGVPAFLSRGADYTQEYK